MNGFTKFNSTSRRTTTTDFDMHCVEGQLVDAHFTSSGLRTSEMLPLQPKRGKSRSVVSQIQHRQRAFGRPDVWVGSSSSLHDTRRSWRPKRPTVINLAEKMALGSDSICSAPAVGMGVDDQDPSEFDGEDSFCCDEVVIASPKRKDNDSSIASLDPAAMLKNRSDDSIGTKELHTTKASGSSSAKKHDAWTAITSSKYYPSRDPIGLDGKSFHPAVPTKIPANNTLDKMNVWESRIKPSRNLEESIPELDEIASSSLASQSFHTTHAHGSSFVNCRQGNTCWKSLATDTELTSTSRGSSTKHHAIRAHARPDDWVGGHSGHGKPTAKRSWKVKRVVQSSDDLP